MVVSHTWSFVIHAGIDGSMEKLCLVATMTSHPIAYPGLGAPTAGDILVMGCPLMLSSCIHVPPSPSAPAAWSHGGCILAGRVAGARAPQRGQGWQKAACSQAALTLLPWHCVQTSWGDVIFPGAGALGARRRLVDICFNKNHAGVCKPF